MSSVRIVTDSACDVPPALAAQYGIHVIPVYINFGLESYLDDGVAITKEQFFARLATAAELPTTAAYSPGIAEETLRAALAESEHVVAIHLSRNLSACLESTRIAAQNVGADRVTVIDTGTLSMGAGWAVLAGAEAATQGADPQTVVQVVNSTIERSSLWAVPSTMEYLRRSGRVNTLIASLGELLQIKPVIEVMRGEVKSAGRVRTFKKVIPHLVELAQSQAPLERLAVLHLNNPEGAAELAEALRAVAPPQHMLTVMACAGISVNFGPGGLGIATVRQA